MILSGKIIDVTNKREEKIQEMTDLVGKMAKVTKEFITSYGMMATEEAIRSRTTLVKEL